MLSGTDLAWIAAGAALGAYFDHRELARCQAIARQTPGAFRLPCRRGVFYTVLVGGSVAVAALVQRR